MRPEMKPINLAPARTLLWLTARNWYQDGYCPECGGQRKSLTSKSLEMGQLASKRLSAKSPARYDEVRREVEDYKAKQIAEVTRKSIRFWGILQIIE